MRNVGFLNGNKRPLGSHWEVIGWSLCGGQPYLANPTCVAFRLYSQSFIVFVFAYLFKHMHTWSIYVAWVTDTQIEGQTNIQTAVSRGERTDRQTDRQTGRQTDEQTNIQTSHSLGQALTYTHTHTHTHSHTYKQQQYEEQQQLKTTNPVQN